MPNMNSGYSGWSMSNRAREAYLDGEMPKSRWTKEAMQLAIGEAIGDDYELLDLYECMSAEAHEYLGTMTKAELFDRFFVCSSWHHTSKYFNATDFYRLDVDRLREFLSEPTAREYYLEAFAIGERKRPVSTTLRLVGAYKTRKAAENALAGRSFCYYSPMRAWRHDKMRIYARVRFDELAI